jgi:DNA-binding NarL/FixJ family response regulator
MKVSKSKCIVIGTTSKIFSDMIIKSVRGYCRYNIVTAFNDWDLKSAVKINKPYLVLVDSCAWQNATPHMIELFKKRYPKTLVAVFSYESMTLKEAVAMIERGARGMVNFRFDEYASSRGIKTLINGEEYIPPEVEEAGEGNLGQRRNALRAHARCHTRSRALYRINMRLCMTAMLSLRRGKNRYTSLW